MTHKNNQALGHTSTYKTDRQKNQKKTKRLMIDRRSERQRHRQTYSHNNMDGIKAS